MKRLLTVSLRIVGGVMLLWAIGFFHFTRPWVLPDSLADAVCSGNPVGAYRRLASGDDVNGRNDKWPYDGLPLFLLYDNTSCQKPFADPPLGMILFRNGADIHVVTDLNYSLLMLASGEGHLGNVTFLLEKGIDPNIQDVDGETALMSAALLNHIHVAEMLIRHGADLRLTDKKGQTAADLARERGHQEMMQLLEARAR